MTFTFQRSDWSLFLHHFTGLFLYFFKFLQAPGLSWAVQAFMTLWIYDGLIECADFNDGQQLFYQVPSLQDLFKTDKADVILDFLKLKAAAQYRLL